MTGDEIITFEAYYDPMLAQIIKGRLEANEIPCFLVDETTIGINPLYNNALGGVKLKIFARDEERCREILAEDIEDIPDQVIEETADRCPLCNSSNISYGQATKKRIGWIQILISILLTIYPFWARKAWHCYDCGEDFSQKEIKPDLQ